MKSRLTPLMKVSQEVPYALPLHLQPEVASSVVESG